MSEYMRLEIVTPEKAVVSEDVQIVMAPGNLGEFGALKGHTPFMTSLKIGSLKYKNTQGELLCAFVSGGFAEVLPDKVTVLAESAELSCDIDPVRARAALERAQKRMSGDETDIDFVRVRAAFQRATYRLMILQ